MSRLLRAKTFTCRGCSLKHPRPNLAMYTAQTGLCRDCFNNGVRLMVKSFGPAGFTTMLTDVSQPDSGHGATVLEECDHGG